MAICFLIGGIEVLSLIPYEINGVSQTHGFWGFMYNFNINTAGLGDRREHWSASSSAPPEE